jgi:hypothetical protein
MVDSDSDAWMEPDHDADDMGMRHFRRGGRVMRWYAGGGEVKPLGGASPTGSGDATSSGPDYSSHPSDPWQDQGFSTWAAGRKFDPHGTGAGSLASAYDEYLHSPQGVAAYSAGGAHGRFDPNDPYAAFTGDTRSDWAGMLNSFLGQAGNAGAFDPNGSAAITAGLRRSALSDANALGQRTRNQANLLGLDPGAAASYAMESDINGQGHVQDVLANADLQQKLSAQDFARNIYNGYLGSNYGFQGQRLQRQLMPKQNSWGRIAGSVVGTGLGALFGPGGAAAGNQIGGQLGGGFDAPYDEQYA